MKNLLSLFMAGQMCCFFAAQSMTPLETKVVMRNFKLTDEEAYIKAARKSNTEKLCRAVVANNTYAVTNYLARGADVNGINEQGDQPLLLSVLHKQYTITPLLLSFKANPNIRDATGTPVLHLLVRAYVQDKKLAFAIAALLKSDVDILLRDARQQTALHVLVIEGLKSTTTEQERIKTLIKLLIARGCSKDIHYAYAQDEHGNTIFDYADESLASPINTLLTLKKELDLQNSILNINP